MQGASSRFTAWATGLSSTDNGPAASSQSTPEIGRPTRLHCRDGFMTLAELRGLTL
ncbi:MAG: hypothetical protein MZV63_14220 [Marinilabiliales bacterium]|nr:hypothetical protein [Marinilabiliales bacterium]